MSLDYDYEMLLEDSEHLERCAAQGLSIHSPGVAVVARRWGVMPSAVAQESIGSAIGDGVKAGAHMTAEASKKILVRFKDWAVEYGKEYAQKLAELTSKGAFLERHALKVKQRYDLTKVLPEHNEIEAGGWSSKVCLDDKVDVHACIELSNRIGPLTQMTKKYTVLVRSVARGQRVKDDALRPLGRSTNRAVKRAAGLLGIVNPFGKVEAYSLPGNVVVVEHGAKVDFAVARDGDYGHTLPRLSHEEIGQALSAAFTLAGEIKKRGVERQGFSYGAINDEIAQLFKDIENLEGQELKDATLRLRNAIRIENAICTSFVRTCEGLLEYSALSLK